MLLFIICIFICMLFCCSASDPYKLQQQKFESNIENCLRQVRMLKSDVNKDGEINCQDYALLFYTAWNNSGYSDAVTVALVHNYNPPSMNHLLCAVRITKFDQWEFVEPQAWLAGDYVCSYDPAEYWGSMYNPNCNSVSTLYLYNEYYTNKIRGK